MTLIKSISGIRGTIGGIQGDNLTPIDIVACTAGLSQWLLKRNLPRKIVVGRDGRISGAMVSNLAVNTLISMGIDVIDLGLSTTPTVEMAVPKNNAGAGIIFTASHNPKQWNALKFLNSLGEFISPEDGLEIVAYIDHGQFHFAETDQLGCVSYYDHAIQDHILEILKYRHVQIDLIRQAKIKVVVDCINSTGALAVPPLLDALGVEYVLIHADNFGHFAHNPEPLPHHLEALSKAVIDHKAHLGISVDPDVDRLAFVNEDGSMFGEEYTLVAIADYILSREKGNTVSNLSSTRALSDVTIKHGGQYTASAVGEVNVVNAMKANQAVIGGEGNGGVIVPDLHYGRDALIGIALFLSHFAKMGMPMTALKATYPSYQIIKDKIELTPETDINHLITKVKSQFANEKLNETDGLKIDFAAGWVHMRKSNTEPIIRVYCEAQDEATALALINQVKSAMS
ncbi:MAG: phosphoglucosamine mutase [Chitinophagales bacterium]|nr:phosphoglucosamine mutase [Chitinophagales bacterium]